MIAVLADCCCSVPVPFPCSFTVGSSFWVDRNYDTDDHVIVYYTFFGSCPSSFRKDFVSGSYDLTQGSTAFYADIKNSYSFAVSAFEDYIYNLYPNAKITYSNYYSEPTEYFIYALVK